MNSLSLHHKDNAFRIDTLSSRQLLTRDQIELMILLMEDLCDASRTDEEPFRDWPEVQRVITGAYACGFVCKNMTHVKPDKLDALLRDPEPLSRSTLKDIRRFIHMMMRAERWADCGGETGGGAVHSAWRNGALRILAARLRRILEAPYAE